MRAGLAKPILFIIVSVIAIALAATLDARVAVFMKSSGTAQFVFDHKLLHGLMKTPGEYWFTCAVMIGVFFSRLKWRATVLVLLGTTASGVNGLIKWMVGRIRPYKLHPDLVDPFSLHPFRGGFSGLFPQTNLSFPSGHATLAFATATALGILWPRWRWAFYPLAMVVAAERVLENAHWLSDTVAAAALGIGCVWIVRRLLWDNNQWGKRNDERDTVSVAGHSRV